MGPDNRSIPSTKFLEMEGGFWRAPSVFTVSDLTVNQKQFRGLACG